MQTIMQAHCDEQTILYNPQLLDYELREGKDLNQTQNNSFYYYDNSIAWYVSSTSSRKATRHNSLHC